MRVCVCLCACVRVLVCHSAPLMLAGLLGTDWGCNGLMWVLLRGVLSRCVGGCVFEQVGVCTNGEWLRGWCDMVRE